MNQPHNPRSNTVVAERPDRVRSTRIDDAARRPRWRRLLPLCAVALLLLPTLAACGFGDDDDPGDERTGKITWYQGVPPENVDALPAGAGVLPTADPSQQQQPPVATQQPAAEPSPTVTPPPAETPTPQPTPLPIVTNTILTDEQIALYQPNELGSVPVLMYHNIVTECGPDEEGDVLFRTVDEFIGDLQWLYDHDFYVVTMQEYITNQISAPAGKHPVVLVFDDSRPSQFYYDVGSDGTPTLDPDSAVAILEEFFASHPDFGHTAVFAVIPIHCFDYEEPSQTPFCQQKLQWLVNNGYEVANHTWDHQDLGDVSNETFQEKVGETALWLQEQTGVESAGTALILPYGVFPEGENLKQQWKWIRNGFDYNGQHIKLLTVLAAGADPAPSPSNINFDAMSIARIGAKDFPSDGEPDLFLDYWFGQFEQNPESLYTSDGQPDTITIPGGYAGMLDEEKVAAQGKQVIEY
ncbi:hypothetical protein BH20CHL4_BH20CHL4_08040 [soil metagenome]